MKKPAFSKESGHVIVSSEITKWALTKYTADDGHFTLDRKKAHTDEAEEGDHGGEHYTEHHPR